MSTESNAAATAPIKKNRRGISNNTQATSYLKFHEKDARPDGIFVGQLASAEVKWSTFKEGDFAGQSVPKLELHFTSCHQNNDEKRHVFLTLQPVQSSVDTYVNGEKAYFVDSNFKWIKHILDTFYLKGRSLNDTEEDALSLDYNDCDENGNYVPVETEDVLKSWGKLFTNVVAMLNGTFDNGEGATGKICYTGVRVFMKLLRYQKRGRGANAGWASVGNNGDLAFPNFVGEGCLELMKSETAQPVVLKVNVINESITPKQVKQAAAPSMPGNIPGGMPGNPIFGAGVQVGGVANPYADGAGVDGGEMPF